MAIHIGVSRIVGGDCQMGTSHRLPRLGMLDPALWVTTGILRLSLNTETVHAFADGFTAAFDAINAGLGFLICPH